MRRLWPIALSVLCFGGRCGGDGEVVAAAGDVVFRDDFDGPAGQLPDAARWTYDVGGDGWGNNQLEYDTRSPNNVSLDGAGHLVITARKEPFEKNGYTSARILTKGLFAQKYGKFSARMKLPSGGQGIWPAFWLLGADIATSGWPKCGELDIMEFRGQEPGIIHGTAHGPGYSAGGAITARYVLPGGARFDQDFHVFSITWTAARVTWAVDDVAYHSVTPSDLRGSDWVFDHPFFIILNVAVGGNYVGSPNASTVFPTQLVVDWVKVEAVGS